MDKSAWPKTLEEAADVILSRLGKKDKRILRGTKREDLIQYHHGWGTGIRNEFGLWQGNEALLESCGCVHPDDCSMKIMELVWEKLQSGPKKEKRR
jgi:Domain of unknown function (DUF6794)